MPARRRRSRRSRLGAGVLLVASSLLASACTSGGGPTSSAPTTGSSSPSSSAAPSSSAPAQPVTLRFAVYGGREEVTAYRRLARAFTRQDPDVRVRVEATDDADASRARLDRQFGAGRAPDLFLADSSRLASLVADKRVRPLDELLENRGVQFGDGYERLGLEAFAAKGALQCMPNDVSPYVVFYNKSLLDLTTTVQPGQRVPTPEVNGWTWSQFELAARAVSQGGVQGVYLPPQLTTLTPLLRSAGDDIVDDAQKPSTLTLSDSGSRPALDKILELARDHTVNPTPTQLLRQDAVTRFEDGRLAMLLGTRALVPELRRTSGLNFDAYPLPSLGRFQTIADVSGYCISGSTTHVSQAADFVRFASGDRGSRITARSGGVVPANLATLRSRAFVQPNQFPLNNKVFTNVIRRADTMPNPATWPALVDATAPLVGGLFYGPETGVDAELARIDQVSAAVLAGQPVPSASPSD